MQVYFRSDKANMQPAEIAAKHQQASELQDDLRKQIEAKKRIKVCMRLHFGPLQEHKHDSQRGNVAHPHSLQ